MKTPTESYTVISVDLQEPLMMRLEFFINREKMREFLLEYAKEHRRCIVLPGPVDDVDYQVEYESDQETIKTIHFEDEPGYKVPFGLLSPEDLKDIAAEDEEFASSIRNVVSDIAKENSE
jgi:hypothetical protein